MHVIDMCRVVPHGHLCMSAFLATVQFPGRPRAKTTYTVMYHKAAGIGLVKTSNARERTNRYTENYVFN